MSIEYTHTVDLGERSYPIHIGKGLITQPELLRDHIKGTSVVIVSNSTIAPLYLEPIESNLKNEGFKTDVVILEDGEQFKTFSSVEKIIDCLLTQRHDRKTTLIALGGGVVGDITGFAAAIYQRGVNFIQIPTTLLSQVDSSVGGKTGVNHPKGKNMIGAFYQPQCVLIDTNTLSTLPDRELSAGLAEVIKYGLINDASFFGWLETHMDQLTGRDDSLISQAILRSCEIKAEVVAEDEKESGIRAILNLGHTFGHAIETAMGYGNWLHGEAVAAGMVMATELSLKHGWIESDVLDRCRKLIKLANLPTTPPAEISEQQYMDIMAIDKKVDQGKIRFVLLKSLGNAIVTDQYQPDLLQQTLQG